MKYLIPLLALLLSAPLHAKPLTILAWNIWHKGHLEKFGEKGCEETEAILKAANPDVILMVETYGSGPRTAKALGYHHKVISANLSIHSRYPITKTHTLPGIRTFNCGGVQIDFHGQPVNLFATWLHYLPDARLVPTQKTEAEIIAWEKSGSRTKEITAILKALQPHIAQADTIPLIIGGDFNIHSHLDWIPATKDLYNHGGIGSIAWPVSKAMEAAGFTDSYRAIHPHPAQNLGPTWLEDAGPGIETTNRRDRIDYIYTLGATPTAAEAHQAPVGQPLTFRDKTFTYPSDHGFVLTTIEIQQK